MGHWIHLTRNIVFGVVTLLTIVIFAMSAHIISITTTNLDVYFTYAALALAVCILSFSIPALWIVDFLRSGAFTSLIIVELPWLGFLWVMWLASAALSSQDMGIYLDSCSSVFEPDWYKSSCAETKAIVAFSWLIWIGLTGYAVSLLTLAIIAHNNGAPIWKTSVKEANFDAIHVNSPSVEHKAPVGGPLQQQPVLQQQYPPQQPGYPQQGYTPTQV